MEIREITPQADKDLADIIRKNFVKYKLDIPGTAYYDPELDHLSAHYLNKVTPRNYYVMWDEGQVCGGMGYTEFEHYDNCVELQKLYLAETVKGRGWGSQLFDYVENEARKAGYKMAYIETHSNLDIAVQLYLRHGYTKIDTPEFVNHSAMDIFLIKNL